MGNNDGEWMFIRQHTDSLIRAGIVSAAIRAADDADWEQDEALDFNEPFDPFADEAE